MQPWGEMLFHLVYFGFGVSMTGTIHQFVFLIFPVCHRSFFFGHLPISHHGILDTFTFPYHATAHPLQDPIH